MRPDDKSRTSAEYHRSGRRRFQIVVSLSAVLCGLLLIDIGIGPAGLSIREVVAAIFSPATAQASVQTIVWTFRLPTALMAVVVGAALGIAGAEMQTILNNPLASPYTLGISAAASFGAALALVFGATWSAVSTPMLIPGFAFVAALICSMMIYGIGSLRGGSTETIIVGGVALHFIFSSGVAFLQYVAADDALNAIVFWIFGSLQGANWEKLVVISMVLALSMIPLLANAWSFTALRLGENHARSLGVNVRRLRLQTLLLISIITATAVCFTGAIGFVGLVAPHLARMLVGEDQRYFLPASGLLGAVLISAADILCKSLVPGIVFPIGIATAMLGAPFFAGVALFARRRYW